MKLSSASIQSIENSILVNLYGVYIATYYTLRNMIEMGVGGAIINITSGAADKPYEGWASYCSQKAAINMFTRCIALENYLSNIIVFGISPGPIDTDMQKSIRNSRIEDFPAKSKFDKLYEDGKLISPDVAASFIVDIVTSRWKSLSGTINDLRDVKFRAECSARGVMSPVQYEQ